MQVFALKVYYNNFMQCSVCGEKVQKWKSVEVISDLLASNWNLSPAERDRFNHRESSHCPNCNASARSRGVAEALLTWFPVEGVSSIKDWSDTSLARTLRIAEINRCEYLHEYIKDLPGLSYSEYYPEDQGMDASIQHQDITDLTYTDNSFDLVLHSETLEHIPNYEKAIGECRRILDENGVCIFTVPMIQSRITRQCASIDSKTGTVTHLQPATYHGGGEREDYLVFWEFGGDFIKKHSFTTLIEHPEHELFVLGHGKQEDSPVFNTVPKPAPNIPFTGERLIPRVNAGAGFFYEHIIRYLFSSQLCKGKKVLDAGCGAGYGSKILATTGQADHVTGMDISNETVEYARHFYGQETITFTQGSVEDMTQIEDGSMDVVVSFEVIEHLQDQNAFLNEVKRVLKPDGIFIVSTPNKYTYPEGNPYHTKELYPEEFVTLMNEYYTHVEVYHQSFEFAQLLKRAAKATVSIEDQFVEMSQKSYTTPVDPKKSQYIVTVCSNGELPDMETTAVTAKRVDGFNLSKGIVSLGEQFGELENQRNSYEQSLEQIIDQLREEQRNLETSILHFENEVQQKKEFIESVRNSMFYKVWNPISQIKNLIRPQHD